MGFAIGARGSSLLFTIAIALRVDVFLVPSCRLVSCALNKQKRPTSGQQVCFAVCDATDLDLLLRTSSIRVCVSVCVCVYYGYCLLKQYNCSNNRLASLSSVIGAVLC